MGVAGFNPVINNKKHFIKFLSRLSCYKCITDTMQELVNQSKAAPQSPSVPKQPGPPVMTSDPNMLSNEDAAAHVSYMPPARTSCTSEFKCSVIYIFHWKYVLVFFIFSVFILVEVLVILLCENVFFCFFRNVNIFLLPFLFYISNFCFSNFVPWLL